MANHMMTSRVIGSLLAIAAVAGLAHAQTATAPAVQSTTPAQQAPAAQPAPAQPPAETPQTEWDLWKSAQAFAAGDGVPKDTAKARQLFEQVMASDNKQAAAAAAYSLGKLAADEIKDPVLAARAFDRGIELGSPWSMIARAQQLAQGKAKDQKRAVELYLRAAETEKTPVVEKSVYGALGRLYLGPTLLSAKQAEDYLQRAAALGDPWALMALGGMYEKGTGTKKNWTKARDYYEKALATDLPQVKGAAAYALAQLYSQPGRVAPKKAFDYLLTSEKYGNPWASMMLADRYSKGLGVKKSTATARRLYTELRNGTDENVARAAAMQLGRLYSVSPGRNLKLAEENFSYASQKGEAWASFLLAQLYINDMPSKANRRKARELLKTLAQNEDPKVRQAASGLLKRMR